jgi:predicted Zn-dependent peptidase
VIKKTLLPNGIRIVTEKMPYVRSVSMGVWVNVGARDESDTQCGLSHFIEHMIFKGTTRRSAFQIAKEFDAVGGHSNAFTSMENTCYHARVMDAHLGTMVDILSDIFLNSVFDPLEIERERQVIFQEIGMVEDTPEEYVHLLTGANFWGNHPLGRSILGSRENILNFDSPMIKSFFGTFYHPERIVIAVTGNVDHQRIVDLVGPSFESIRCGEDLQPRCAPQPGSGVRLHQRPLEQVQVCLAAPGLAVTDPRRFTFSLLNTLLGGNMSSRLFQEIREKRGLAYSVYSFVSSHVDTGMFGVYAGVNAQDVSETIRLTLQGMAQMGRSPVSPEELHDAKEYTKGNLLLAAESVDNQMVRLAQNEIHYNQYIPLESVISAVEAITAEEILALAQTLFRRDQASLTLLGPMDTADGLEQIIAETLG